MGTMPQIPYWIIYLKPFCYLALEFNVLLIALYFRANGRPTVPVYAMFLNCLCLLPLVWMSSLPHGNLVTFLCLAAIAFGIVLIVYFKKDLQENAPACDTAKDDVPET